MDILSNPLKQPGGRVQAGPRQGARKKPADSPVRLTPAQDQAVLGNATEAAGAEAGLIQVGAYSREEAATEAWTELKRRFPSLGTLTPAIVSAVKDGKPMYRLRATGEDAEAACRSMQEMGQSCVVIASAPAS